MKPLSKLMISCKEATLLIIKKEEHKTSLIDRLKLFIHLFICDFCKTFAKQSKFINLNTPHSHKDIHISDEFKHKLIHSLKES